MKKEKNENLRAIFVNYLIIAFTVFLFGCSGGGGGGGSGGGGSSSSPSEPPLEGFDLTGTYSLLAVECYNSSLTAGTSYALIGGSQTTTLTINKNSYQEVTHNGTCTSTTSGKIVYTTNDLTAIYSNRSVTTTTLGTCTYTYNLTDIVSVTTPGSLVLGHTHGPISGTSSSSMIRASSGDLFILSGAYQRSGAPSDLCFIIYDKQ